MKILEDKEVNTAHMPEKADNVKAFSNHYFFYSLVLHFKLELANNIRNYDTVSYSGEYHVLKRQDCNNTYKSIE